MQKLEIVITGGPCAGKTSCLNVLENTLKLTGLKVIIVPELATEIIKSGLCPNKDLSVKDFQELLMLLSLKKEKLIRNVVSKMKQDTVIIYDRGVLDSKAFLSKKEFHDIITTNNLNENKILNNYDAVFHLVSAAKGAETFYTLANNDARLENIEQARIVDDNTILAWEEHPCFSVIENNGSFDEKVKNLNTKILSFINNKLHNSNIKNIIKDLQYKKGIQNEFEKY